MCKCEECTDGYVPDPDFVVTSYGTVCLVRPVGPFADAVESWFTSNTDAEVFGGAFVVEPRYVESIVQALEDEGFDAAA